MALRSMMLLSQATCYCLTLILSLCTLIPMAIHMRKFGGHCLLYTSGKFDSDDGHFVADWASPFYCVASLLSSSLALLLSLVQLFKTTRHMCRNIDVSFLGAFVDTMCSTVTMCLVFVSSVFVSDGFRQWCGAINQRFPDCEDASVTQIDPQDGIDTHGFYIDIGSVQFGTWTAFTCWVLQSVLCTRKLCLIHERENILVAMARERRLFNASLEQEGLRRNTNDLDSSDDRCLLRN